MSRMRLTRISPAHCSMRRAAGQGSAIGGGMSVWSVMALPRDDVHKSRGGEDQETDRNREKQPDSEASRPRECDANPAGDDLGQEHDREQLIVRSPGAHELCPAGAPEDGGD